MRDPDIRIKESSGEVFVNEQLVGHVREGRLRVPTSAKVCTVWHYTNIKADVMSYLSLVQLRRDLRKRCILNMAVGLEDEMFSGVNVGFKKKEKRT